MAAGEEARPGDPRRRAGSLAAEVGSLSSLPESMFTSGAAELANAIDDHAATIIRNYLAMEAPTPLTPFDTDDDLRTESVAPEELRALCQRLSSEEKLPVPELMEHLEHERLWILADSTLNGSSAAARSLAAELLRETIDELHIDSLDDEVTERLVRVMAPGLVRDGDGGESRQ